jgi:hypothetical protein
VILSSLALLFVVAAAACQSQEAGPAHAATPPGGRHGPPQVIKTVSYALEAANVDRAVRALRRAVVQQEGWIASANVRHEDGGAGFALVHARVPAAKLDEIRAAVDALGEIRSEDESAEDAGDRLVDLETRLTVKRAEEARLLALLERGTTLADVMAVERELAARREAIEIMAATQASLRERVAYAEVVVEIRQPAIAFWEKPGETIAASASTGLELAAAVAVGTVSGIAALGPSLLMIGLVIAILVLSVRGLWRLRHRRVAAS